jgi:probable HAF family extracellular repeat protein
MVADGPSALQEEILVIVFESRVLGRVFGIAIVAAMCGVCSCGGGGGTSNKSYTVTDLGVESSFAIGEGHSINNVGQVVGTNASGHVVVWQDGNTTDLGTMGGVSASSRAINDAGQVTGNYVDASQHNHAFLWSSGTTTTIFQPGTVAFDVSASGAP